MCLDYHQYFQILSNLHVLTKENCFDSTFKDYVWGLFLSIDFIKTDKY